jgi:hypothetical protein
MLYRSGSEQSLMIEHDYTTGHPYRARESVHSARKSVNGQRKLILRSAQG